MKILIICTYFSPDTAIAAVRPYMFAKYLSRYGHDVTVLRSGEIHQTADLSMPVLNDVQVISYLGENAPAEQFERGVKKNQTTTKISFASSLAHKIPTVLRPVLERAYMRGMQPKFDLDRLKQAKNRFTLQKRAIDRLNPKDFDLVFSTYGELENIMAGSYIAENYGVPWICDFRDLVVGGSGVGRLWNRGAGRILHETVHRAHALTCVSLGLSTIMQRDFSRPMKVLYNGYDGEADSNKTEASSELQLVLCYTGQFYPQRVMALEPVIRAVADLVKGGKIKRKNVRFDFAGSNVRNVYPIFEKYGLLRSLNDFGYISRTAAADLQAKSDVFLVLSWNTRKEQGILTGKFYEGIRAQKPILASVTGDLAGSELWNINEQYHYGFCYECARSEQNYRDLVSYLYGLIEQKRNNGTIQNEHNSDLEKVFKYSNITRSLERLMQHVVHEAEKL